MSWIANHVRSNAIVMPCPHCGHGARDQGGGIFQCANGDEFEVGRCSCGAYAARNPEGGSWWCTDPGCDFYPSLSERMAP